MKDTVPTPRFSESFEPEIIHPTQKELILQSFVVDHERFHISGLHFFRYPTLSTFSFLKRRFKTEVRSCFQITLGGNVMDQRSGED